MAHFRIGDLPIEDPIPESVDTLVIGAGMAGLYSTYQILKKDENADIMIFESSVRTGGRLDSDLITFNHVLPGGGTEPIEVKEEEGGMRFTFDTMDNLMALFLDLGLTDHLVPFPMNSDGNNRLYFRGHSFNNNQSAENDYEIWEQLYNLQPSESGFNPKDIINTVFNRILSVNPAFDSRVEPRDPVFWQKFRLTCQWKGIVLKDWTLWGLFTDMGYSSEAITMLYRLLGFNGTFLSRMNAGEAYQLLEDFPADPDFKTLDDGFSLLPNALVDKITKDYNRKIYLQTRLISIDEYGSNGCSLTYTTQNRDGEVTKTITANKVILGIPRLALEKLFVRSNAFNMLQPDLSAKIWDQLQTTSNQPLLKINLYYDFAWWGNSLSGQPGVAFGPNFSDLPLGSVYPFYAVSSQVAAGLELEKWASKHDVDLPEPLKKKLADTAATKYKMPAALTIYCDYLNINFWKALMHTSGTEEEQKAQLFSSPMQEKYSNEDPQTIFPATKEVVRVATEFFRKLFNTHFVPEPVMTSARIWEGSTAANTPPSQQFGYGVHQWALGAQDDEVQGFLTEPLDNIYTCGEAYSDYQGWVEGALRSADLVLKKGWSIDSVSDQYQEQHGESSSEAIKKAYAKKVIEDIVQYLLTEELDGLTVEALAAAQGTNPVKGAEKFGLSLSYFDQE